MLEEKNDRQEEIQTPEQELEEQKRLTAEQVLQRQQLELQVQKQEEEWQKELSGERLKADAKNAFIAIGRQPHDLDVCLKKMKLGENGLEIRRAPDGSAEPCVNGAPVSWEIAAQFFYNQNTQFFHQDVYADKSNDDDSGENPKERAINRLARENGGQRRDHKVLARSDLRSIAAKSNFISQFGLQAWEALPSTRDGLLNERNPHKLTAAEYHRLSTEEKTRIISEIGHDGLLRILRRK